MYCSQCGIKVVADGRFCSNCGTPTQGGSESNEELSFHLADLRVPYGTATEETLPPSEQNSEVVRVPKDSDLARNAKTAFAFSSIPEDGALVPLNCVWAFVRHPGPISERALSASSIDKKFVEMGDLRGRTFHEIEEVAGPPLTQVRHPGGMNAVWGKTGFFSIWQIALTFDPYGVCMGVYSETNM